MLLSASTRMTSPAVRRRPGLFGRLDGFVYDVAIGVEPLGLLDELAALDLEDLHPAAALVIVRRDLQRRDQSAEREVLDLLEALLDVVTGRLLATVGLDRIAQRLDLDSRLKDAAVIDNRVVHFLRRFFTVLFVHILDLLTDRIVVAGAGELHRVVALGDAPAAGRLDVV